MYYASAIQITVMAVLIAVLIVLLLEYIRYLKLKRLFKSDYLRSYKQKAVRKFPIIVPAYKSNRYNAAAGLMEKAGWNISVEHFYICKAFLFLIALAVLISVNTTNGNIEIEHVIEDANYKKAAIDTHVHTVPETVELEKSLFELVNNSYIDNKELFAKKLKAMNLEYIQHIISQSGLEIKENLDTVAKRLLEKLLYIRAKQSDYGVYIFIFLFSLLFYMLPDFLAFVKIKLIEDKKEWEVLNCIYAFSIFGSLPPYSVRNVLESMEMVTEAYKPLISKLLEGIKKGASDRVFDEVLERVDNDDLYELLETMKLACDTGILDSIEDLDEMAEQKQKWMDIRGLRRRRTKRLYAITLVALMFLLAGIYFSYGLTLLANPTYLVP
ncbi:MAG: hypothetical protein ACOZCL_05750 [Bacillota bacterium]